MAKRLSVVEHIYKRQRPPPILRLDSGSHIPFIAEVNEEFTAFTLRMRSSFPIQLPSAVSLVCSTLDWGIG